MNSKITITYILYNYIININFSKIVFLSYKSPVISNCGRNVLYNIEIGNLQNYNTNSKLIARVKLIGYLLRIT